MKKKKNKPSRAIVSDRGQHGSELSHLKHQLKVEAALDRVRVRANEMHSSNELSSLVHLLFDELSKLDLVLARCIIWIFDKKSGGARLWMLNTEDKKTADSYWIQKLGHRYYKAVFNGWRKKKKIWSYDLSGTEKSSIDKLLLETTELKNLPAKVKSGILKTPHTFIHGSFNAFGFIEASGTKHLTVEQQEIVARFSMVFEQAYTRFLDLLKAEAQAREAQIEAALERIRAASMAMHKSVELHKVINVLSEQLIALRIEFDSTLFTQILADGSWNTFISTPVQTYPAQLHIPFIKSPPMTSINRAFTLGKEQLSDRFSQMEKNIFFNHFFTKTVAHNVPYARKKYVLESPGLAWSVFFMKNIILLVTNYKGVSFTVEENAIFKRFKNVFEQAFTRFLDLQKAEAQAREAQIEAALERVRAASMAMHKSEELQGAVNAIIGGLNDLSIEVGTANILFIKDNPKRIEYWTAASANIAYSKVFIVPFSKIPYTVGLYKAMEKKQPIFSLSLSRKKKNDLYRYLFTQTDFKAVPAERQKFILACSGAEIVAALEGSVGIQLVRYNSKPFCQEDISVLHRFAKVFKQTYTRFLDLQKAEAQAREAEIQLALERVRARTMAMHKSDDLAQVATVLFEQISLLDNTPERFNIRIINEAENAFDFWATDQRGRLVDKFFKAGFKESPVVREMYKSWKSNKRILIQDLHGGQLSKWVHFIKNELGVPFNLKGLKDHRFLSSVFFSHGLIGITTNEAPNPDTIQLIERFTKVFQQTYTRFLDLQKAEAQAREAQIEAALERVRSKTMAMHNSDEFLDVIQRIYNEFQSFGFEALAADLMIFTPDGTGYDIWISGTVGTEGPFRTSGKLLLHPHHLGTIQAWKDQKNHRVTELSGKFFKSYFELVMDKSSGLKQMTEKRKDNIRSMTGIIHTEAFTKHGCIRVASSSKRSEQQIDIQKRFASVFEQSYTRFLDLQKAEAQAREAEIQLALERVRSAAMAMHSSEELSHTIKVLFDQLNILGIELVNTYLVLYDLDKNQFSFRMTGKKGNQLSEMLTFSFDELPGFKPALKAWKLGLPVIEAEYRDDNRKKWLDLIKPMNSKLPVRDQLRLSDFPNGVYSCSGRHEFGSLGIIKKEKANDEDKQLLLRFAKEFNLTYSRFLDLQKAETQAREAQIEVALEKVRSRSLAMHKSDELSQVVALLYQQLALFGFAQGGCELILCNEMSGLLEYWHTNPVRSSLPECFMVSPKVHHFFMRVWKAWKEQKPRLVIEMKGKEKHKMDMAVLEKTDFRKVDKKTKNWILRENLAVFSHSIMKYGLLESVDYVQLSEHQFSILQRFAKVFEQTYTRFLDLQNAEVQAREAQIEAALEKVRARMMAMHQSTAFPEVMQVIAEQLLQLGIEMGSINFMPSHAFDGDFNFWAASSALTFPARIQIPFTNHPLLQQINQGKAEGREFIAFRLNAQESKSWWQYFISKSNIGSTIPDERKKYLLNRPGYFAAATYRKNSVLLLANYDGLAFTEEETKLFNRFATVFEQTYTRFLDLQKAEAQAREAEIELALERIRARTMAIQKSSELSEVIAVVFEQLNVLGFTPEGCDIIIYDKEKLDAHYWFAGFEKGSDPKSYLVPYHEHPYYQAQVNGWKNGEKYKAIVFEGELKKKFDDHVFTKTGFKNFPKSRIKKLKSLKYAVIHDAFMSHGAVETIDLKQISNEKADVLQRIAKVFDQTYTRFLDFQKAEAQAREAEIQLALERVRARTMAMHKSEELGEVSVLLYQELNSLGVSDFYISGYVEVDEENNLQRTWMTKPDGTSLGTTTIPLKGDPVLDERYKNWRKGNKMFHQRVSSKQLADHIQFVSPSFRDKEVANVVTSFPSPCIFYCSNFQFGYLHIITGSPLDNESESLLIRFTEAFEMTYKRFLDLQKAEAQAREAQIQLSLERVRARTMAMQSSDELAEVSFLLNKQVIELGIPTRGCAFNIYNEHDSTEWFSNLEGTLPTYKTPREKVFLKYYEAGQRGETLFIEEYSGKKIKDHYKYLFKAGIFGKDVTEGTIKAITPEVQIDHVAYFKYGYLLFITLVPAPDAHGVFRRFAKEFEQTYTRFLDLQKAEAQARQAQIELGLERVRARAMAMKKSDELAELISTVFLELTKLDFALTRTMLWFFDEDQYSYEVWMANSETDKTAGSLKMPIEHPFHKRLFNKWKERKSKWIYELKGEEKKQLDDYLFSKTVAANLPEEVKAGIRAPERIINSFSFHDFGGLLADGLEELSDDNLEILYRFAKEFDVTYTRFLDLQKAEAQAREAEIQLALERVRAQTMAMHNSDDMGNCVLKMFDELIALGVDEGTRFGIGILNHDDENNQVWTARKEGEEVKIHIGNLDMTLHPLLKGVRNAWKEQLKLHQYVLEGDDLLKYYQMINNARDYKLRVSTEKLPAREFHYGFIFSHGFFYAFSPTEFHPELIHIAQRFSALFEQTYTRFLDLQKAEAQAREAEIQLALERVRARTMAMQKSDELSDVVKVFYEQIRPIGIAKWGCTLMIFNEQAQFIENWFSGHMQSKLPECYYWRGQENPVVRNMWSHWKKQHPVFTIHLKDKEKYSFDVYLQTKTDYANLPDVVKKGMINEPVVYFTCATMKYGMIHADDLEPIPEENKLILKRFADVFEQSYTRFLDLQKAEAQAREAQIEAALERVRSRSMGMQKSDELHAVNSEVRQQVKALDINLFAFGIHICREDEPLSETWMGDAVEGQMPPVTYDHSGDPLAVKMYDGWKKKKTLVIETMEGNKLAEHFDFMATVVPDRSIFENTSPPKSLVYHFAYFMHGFFVFVTFEESPHEHSLFTRFAKVFEQTYTRFLDLQKAEAQARESQIQLSLERVRSRAMAMHQSDELSDVLSLMFDQFDSLEIRPSHATISLLDLEQNTFTFRMTGKKGRKVMATQVVSLDALDMWKTTVDQFKAAKLFQPYTNEYPKEVLPKLWKLVAEVVSAIPEDDRPLPDEFPDGMFEAVGFYKLGTGGSMGTVSICQNRKVTEEEKEIVGRFATEFGRVYQRFLDLQKAEAQAREAQIEASLERVRASMMAMHQSDGLPEVMKLIAEQLIHLGIRMDAVTFSPMDEEKDLMFWTATTERTYPVQLIAPYIDHTLFNRIHEGKTKGLDFITIKLSKEERDAWWRHFFTNTNAGPLVPEHRRQYIDRTSGYASSMAFRKSSTLNIVNYAGVPFSEEENSILKRFANVFDQSYIRFLDLQKAEGQAREAQIEAALEKVRSRSLAMHKSEELQDVIKVVLDRLNELGVTMDAANINIPTRDRKSIACWVATQSYEYTHSFLVPWNLDDPIARELKEAYEASKDYYSKSYSKKDKDEYFRALFEHSDFKYIPDERKTFLLKTPAYGISAAGTQNSWIQVISYSGKVLARGDADVLKRFARVFEQCYIRFQDLEKAEAQTREAQIEASLERVRAKAMGMHNTSELTATVTAMFVELRNLGIHPLRFGLGILTKNSRHASLYSASVSDDGGNLQLVGSVLLQNHPVLEKIYDGWHNRREEYFPTLKGDMLKSYYEAIRPGFKIPDWHAEYEQYGQFYYFEEGALYSWSEKPIEPTEPAIFRRFTSVLALTYKRYNELQQAEINSREVVRRASIDRIRADIASMRTRQDLDRITPLIWNELTTLGIPFIRCGVFIMDVEQQRINTFLSTPDGEAINSFHLPYNAQGSFIEIVRYWENKKIYTQYWGETEFLSVADALVKQGTIANREQYMATVPKGIHLHCIPFLQGMLYVGNVSQLQEEDLRLLQSVADAFSTAYARYEDFNKLEAAKQQVDKTLVNLKQAQQQLVQSEKMASLGELTAGIAHEIQNPLNFVNNFSEVNKELLSEMEEAIRKGDFEEAKSIAKDIQGNQEKINLHGKRAEGIVKGMLQHSRGSSGQKELTDINDLCDEYLRLSFHGYRAKDKSFNAKFETNFDPTLPKIKAVPQDIGRVILNLINNAFYAVNQHRTTNNEQLESLVKVSTKNLGDKIEISIKDNGPGIPENIKEKIFQPFFTTKPTGEGTGLGLSLSYDIVKAHGGEMKVEAREDEGSEFRIALPL